MPRPRNAAPDPSPRALQILALLAAGHTKVDIGRELYLTGSTVNTHVRNTFEVLNARTTAQAVAVAIGEGLIPAPHRVRVAVAR